MGRIRTTLIKSTARRIKNKNPTAFKSDFEHNKKELLKMTEIPSKKIRNVLAGYLTKITKQEMKNKEGKK